MKARTHFYKIKSITICKLLLVVLLCAICNWHLFAQNEKTLAKADALSSAGMELIKRETDDSLKEAYKKFSEAGKIYLTLEDNPKLQISLQSFGNNLYKIGEVFRDRKLFKTSNDYFQTVLPIFQKLKDREFETRTLHNIGYNFFMLKENASAAEFYTKALNGYRQLNEHEGETIILTNLSLLYVSLNDNKNVLEIYKQLFEVYQRDKNFEKAALISRQAGNICFNTNEFKDALKFYEQALLYFQAEKKRELESDVLIDIGDTLNALNETGSAVVNFEKALQIRREIKKGENETELLKKLAMGLIFLNEYEKAAIYLQEGLKLAETAQDERLKIYFLEKIGANYTSQNQWIEADKFLRSALELAQKTSNEDLSMNIYINLGYLSTNQGNYEKALEYYKKAHEWSLKNKDEQSEAYILISLADSLWYFTRFSEAEDLIAQARKKLEKFNDPWGESSALLQLGLIYDSQTRYEESLKTFEQALKIARDNKISEKERDILNNYGTVLDTLGQSEKAIELFQQSLVIARKFKDLSSQGIALSNIGFNYYRLENYSEAKNYLEQAVDLLHKAHAIRAEAYSIHNLGLVYYKLKNYPEALKRYDQAHKIYIETKDRRPESYVYDSYGEVYRETQQYEKARENFEKAVLLSHEIGYREVEANALGNLMTLWQLRDSPRLAIFYGKQTVNIYQTIRSGNRNLDKNLIHSFVGSKEKIYRQLADLLVGEGRLTEAEQVLEMLKQEELSDFVRRDAGDVEKLNQRAELTRTENEALNKYNEITTEIAKTGTEYGNLRDRREKGEVLSDEEKLRYTELSKILNQANLAFQNYIKALEEQFAADSDKSKEIKENTGLQADLKKWGNGVVYVYTLVGEDRYRVIITSPNNRIPRQKEIKSKELNIKIQEFRQIIQNPKFDPRPLGEELYNILIKPIEQDLRDLKAKTILWSLDGSLRLLPLSALWDGKEYFGQKYENVVVTLASRTRLGQPVSPNWRILGLGVSEGQTVKEPNGTRDIIFSPLPSVKEELASIVSDSTSAANKPGILPGAKLIDGAFTESAFTEQLLGGYKVVHIASHFNLNPGDAGKSFLLIGNGQALTVNEIKVNQEIDFAGVELLTLSACQTAIDSEQDDTGKEVESFGVIAQQKGAESILATLWSVADESTQVLMSEFYRLRKENPTQTKSQIMQRVQKSMIDGKLTAKADGIKKRAELIGANENKINAPLFPFDKTKPFSHPYYWSPFVLIGNWK